MPQNYSNCFPNGTPPTEYTGNGVETTYNVGFPYQYDTDVLVFVQAVLQTAGTDYTLQLNNTGSGGVQVAQVVFTTAPTGQIYITRQTTLCGTVEGGDFTAGDALTAQKLNSKFNQQLFINQEQQAILQGIMGNNPAGPNFPNILPGEAPTVGDLEDVNLVNPIPDPSLLRWNGTEWVNNDVLESGDAWASNNNTFATTAAGDDRWLGGGAIPDVIGGDGITIVPNTPDPGEVTVEVDEGNGLAIDSDQLVVDPGNGITVDANGVNVSGNQTNIGTVQFGTGATYTFPDGDGTAGNVLATNGGGALFWTAGGGGGGGNLNIVADTAALDAEFAGAAPGDPYLVLDSTDIATADPAITNLPPANTIEGGYGPGVQVACIRANADWAFLRVQFPNTDARYVNITGDTMTGDLILNGAPTAANQAATRAWVLDQIPVVPGNPGDGALTITAGNSLSAAITGGQFTANKADATEITISVDDVFVLTAGDNMTGALTGSPIPILAPGWNLAQGNFWTVAAITVPTPTGMVEGLSGLIRATAQPTWPAAGGGTIFYSEQGPPVVTGAQGAVIPFYCPDNTTILIGNATNIV